MRQLDDGPGTFEYFAYVMTKHEVHDDIEEVKTDGTTTASQANDPNAK